MYNTLYNAIDKMETNVDITGFPLTIKEKVAAYDSLYEQVGLKFYYLNRMKLSKDGNSVLITYNNTDEAAKNKEIVYSKLSHLIYTVARKKCMI